MTRKIALWDAETGRKRYRTETPDMRVRACGNCGRAWDNARITSMTPAPSARCPFEGMAHHTGGYEPLTQRARNRMAETMR